MSQANTLMKVRAAVWRSVAFESVKNGVKGARHFSLEKGLFGTKIIQKSSKNRKKGDRVGSKVGEASD